MKGLYRLTLAPEAFALAVQKSNAISGLCAFKRVDGKWDVGVTPATADLLKQEAEPGENLSNTVLRILKEKAHG